MSVEVDSKVRPGKRGAEQPAFPRHCLTTQQPRLCGLGSPYLDFCEPAYTRGRWSLVPLSPRNSGAHRGELGDSEGCQRQHQAPAALRRLLHMAITPGTLLPGPLTPQSGMHSLSSVFTEPRAPKPLPHPSQSDPNTHTHRAPTVVTL